MSEENEDIYVQLNNGFYFLVDEKECEYTKKNKLWKKFRRLVFSENGNIVKKPSSPHGFAICRSCSQICRLGMKGGTSDMEKHKCQLRKENLVVMNPNIMDDSVRSNERKKEMEKERKGRVTALIKAIATIVVGEEQIQYLTEEAKLKLVYTCLTKIPATIRTFCSDGKSSKERPPSYYEKLDEELSDLSYRAKEAQKEASTQEVYPLIKAQNLAPEPLVYLDLRLSTDPSSYIATGAENMEVTWAPHIGLAVQVSWPRLAMFFRISTQYITFHSMDGRIKHADKRLTKVTGFTPEEVIDKDSHDFIRDDVKPSVKTALETWLLLNSAGLSGQGFNIISYPLKGKNKEPIYLKSIGEIVQYRDETNTLVSGLMLNNFVISEDDYNKEHGNFQVDQNNDHLMEEVYSFTDSVMSVSSENNSSSTSENDLSYQCNDHLMEEINSFTESSFLVTESLAASSENNSPCSTIENYFNCKCG